MRRRISLWSLACGVAIMAAACGGDKVTAPAPCDTYHGGIVAMPDSLPGSYTLTSLCQGAKPDLVPPTATGMLTLTQSDFTASLTIRSQTQTISGTYTTTGEAISVTLGLGQLTGTFRLANDTLRVSGVVGPQALSLVGTRATP
jgi:hypothetical protein